MSDTKQVELADVTAAFVATSLVALINQMAKTGQVSPDIVGHIDGLIDHYFFQVWRGNTAKRERGEALRAMLHHSDLPITPRPSPPA